MYWLIGILIILILIFIAIIIYSHIKNISEHFNKENCIHDCVKSHSKNGMNYPWLNQIHGGLSKIQFMEPPNSGQWNDYTEAIWTQHCKIIDHGANLVDAHIKAFVDPKSRFAKLHFFFKDGTIMEPIRQFYELERDWFKKNGICN